MKPLSGEEIAQLVKALETSGLDVRAMLAGLARKTEIEFSKHIRDWLRDELDYDVS